MPINVHKNPAFPALCREQLSGAQDGLSTSVALAELGTGVEASLRGRAACWTLAVVALGFPCLVGSTGPGCSNAGFPKSLTPFSSPGAAWLRLWELRPRGLAGVTPSLEKLPRGPRTITHLAGVHPHPRPEPWSA